MKKYRTSSIYLDKCMRTIEQNCLMNPTGSFHGADLLDFCSKPKNVYALHLLAASGDIKMLISDNTDIPSAVWLESKGLLRSYTKAEKIKCSIFGFIAGICSTTVIPYFIQYFFNKLFL